MIMAYERNPAVTIRYLNAREFAERIGVGRNTLWQYKLPPPDAMIGDRKGWLPQTIDAWQERRPGHRTKQADENWHLPPEVAATLVPATRPPSRRKRQTTPTHPPEQSQPE
jgi:predicted DNA-binding transcriptional regulator AlpA